MVTEKFVQKILAEFAENLDKTILYSPLPNLLKGKVTNCNKVLNWTYYFVYLSMQLFYGSFRTCAIHVLDKGTTLRKKLSTHERMDWLVYSMKKKTIKITRYRD